MQQHPLDLTIPRGVFRDERLHSTAKLLYAYIRDRADWRGEYTVTQQELASAFHLSTRAIYKWLSILVQKGLLAKTMGNRGNTYHVLERQRCPRSSDLALALISALTTKEERAA